MTALFGFLPAHRTEAGVLDTEADATLRAMGRALRVSPSQVEGRWTTGGLHVGLLEVPGDTNDYSPATSDGRYALWMAGEAYEGGGLVEVVDPASTRSLRFRQSLLAVLLQRGPHAISALDGEYQILLWDQLHGRLTVLNDRFGGLPLYWANTNQSFAFAGGVRGVLMAPGVSAELDAEALREAVSFGGFRLGDRTNVAAVKMLPGASSLVVQGDRTTLSRYFRWPAEASAETATATGNSWKLNEAVEVLSGHFRRAIRRRLAGSKRSGRR